MSDEISDEDEEKPKGTTRRQFVAYTGLAAAGLVAGAVVGSELFPRTVVPPLTTSVTQTSSATTVAAPKLALVWNSDNCTGCESCVYACSQYAEGAGSRALARLTIHKHSPSITYDIETCRQCVSPSCLSVCPVTPKAVYIDAKTGARVINQKTCIGCALCATACPFNANGSVVKFNAAKKTYVKCDLCSSRAQGPACVQVCQWGGMTTKVIGS